MKVYMHLLDGNDENLMPYVVLVLVYDEEA